MKLFFIIILSVFFFCFLGCVRKSENLNRITVWEQEDTIVAKYIDGVFRDFELQSKVDGIEVKRVHYQTEDLTQQFQTASIAGNPPDLILSPSDTAGVFSIAGFIQPVDSFLPVVQYNEAAVLAITSDGKTWGIPVSNGNHLMLYCNKKLIFDLPETTDQFFGQCDRLLKQKKVDYCLTMNLAEPYWLIPWISAFGGWPIKDKKPQLNSLAVKKAISMLLDLKNNKKYVPPECDYNCMDTLFKEEKVACAINGDWTLSKYKELFGKNLGVAKIPRLSETGNWPAPMVSGKYFMFSSKLKGEKLKQAVDLVLFYTNKENQVKQLIELGRLPALKEAGESEAIQSDPLMKASLDQIKVGKPMPMETEMRAIWDSLRPHLGRALTGKSSVDEAAEDMQKNAVQKIREMEL